MQATNSGSLNNLSPAPSSKWSARSGLATRDPASWPTGILVVESLCAAGRDQRVERILRAVRGAMCVVLCRRSNEELARVHISTPPNLSQVVRRQLAPDSQRSHVGGGLGSRSLRALWCVSPTTAASVRWRRLFFPCALRGKSVPMGRYGDKERTAHL